MAQSAIPDDLRQQLENARLDTLALLRALDRLPDARQFIPRLAALFALDADCGEALWALAQPPGTLNTRAMVRDTVKSLARLPIERDRCLRLLGSRRETFRASVEAVRAGLDPREAYNDVPGGPPGSR